MFCPSCGSEERQASQYCRACGTDLRPVRVSIERPDSITASAVSAREEIGRAVAEKIREVEDSRDLKRVAEDVLPQIEKFLESYEEKRLRRVRAGVVVAASGFGTGILGLIMSAVLRGPDAESALIVCGLGVIAFAIGLGLVLNGLLFTHLISHIHLPTYAASAVQAHPQLLLVDAPDTHDLSEEEGEISPDQFECEEGNPER